MKTRYVCNCGYVITYETTDKPPEWVKCRQCGEKIYKNKETNNGSKNNL
jgi:formylmethanofuran dehydrogenase subunit E